VFYVHTCMCLHALRTMSNEEQYNRFVPLVESYKIILSYAQTELSHGTDLKSLQTEAVFERCHFFKLCSSTHNTRHAFANFSPLPSAASPSEEKISPIRTKYLITAGSVRRARINEIVIQ